MQSLESILIILIPFAYLLGIYCVVAIFLTKSRFKAILMGAHIVVIALITTKIFMVFAGIGAAWSGGDTPTWRWLIMPAILSTVTVSLIISLRRFPIIDIDDDLNDS